MSKPLFHEEKTASEPPTAHDSRPDSASQCAGSISLKLASFKCISVNQLPSALCTLLLLNPACARAHTHFSHTPFLPLQHPRHRGQHAGALPVHRHLRLQARLRHLPRRRLLRRRRLLTRGSALLNLISLKFQLVSESFSPELE